MRKIPLPIAGPYALRITARQSPTPNTLRPPGLLLPADPTGRPFIRSLARKVLLEDLKSRGVSPILANSNVPLSTGATEMPGLFSRLTQRPLRTPRRNAAVNPGVDPGQDQLPAALALAREVLHAVEQFVVSTPDLDTGRFLHRMRGTAAGL